MKGGSLQHTLREEITNALYPAWNVALCLSSKGELQYIQFRPLPLHELAFLGKLANRAILGRSASVKTTVYFWGSKLIFPSFQACPLTKYTTSPVLCTNLGKAATKCFAKNANQFLWMRDVSSEIQRQRFHSYELRKAKKGLDALCFATDSCLSYSHSSRRI